MCQALLPRTRVLCSFLLSIPAFGAGYVAGSSLAGQAQSNCEVIMHAYRRSSWSKVVAVEVVWSIEGSSLKL